MYDVIMVGAGAAGLSAALYTTRRTLKTLVISKDLGGQTATTLNMENYPGVPAVEGSALMKTFAEQAKRFGAELVYDEIIRIDQPKTDFIVVTNSDKSYRTRSIILAFGKVPQRLNVPGEGKFTGKGIVYCATCDAPLFADKDVVVVGGGSAAADAALLLSRIAHKVYLVHRRDQFRAEDILVGRMSKEPKIKFIFDSAIKSIDGRDFVESVVVENLKTHKTTDLKVQGVFVEVGYRVEADFISKMIKLNDAGEIIIDRFNQTSVPGIFAAGDVTTVPFKQTIISAGEGAKAALSVYNYLQGIPLETQVEDYNRDV